MTRGNPDKTRNHRWKKGQTGNPQGRPKKIPALALLSNIPEADWQKVISKIVTKAKAGNMRAAEILLDRAYGKPKQSMDFNGSFTAPITGMVINVPNTKKVDGRKKVNQSSQS